MQLFKKYEGIPMDPFNIDILVLNKNTIKQFGEVSSLSIFEPSSDNFHPNGLYSTDIFGLVGSSTRNNKLGYISLNIKVLHPLVYQHIVKLRAFYKDIISSNKYATFDKEKGDFELATKETGETGYHFFIKHIDKLNLTSNGSDIREARIEMIKKYGNQDMMLSEWIVLPAGLREYTVSDDGKPSEDEVNGLYRKLMNTAGLLKNTTIDYDDPSALDQVRFKLQNIVLELYDHFRALLDGKHKFILGKWSKRAISYGTRNVLTSLPIVYDDLKQKNKIGFNDTVVGLYQYIASINPVTKNKLSTMFMNRIFNPDNTTSILVNPKTMESEYVDIDVSLRDIWITDEGLNGVIHKMAQEELRSDPVMVGNHYLVLIYDNGKDIEVIYNTTQISDRMAKSHIRPITYAELFYLAIYDTREIYSGFITRYPVAGVGGIYPSKMYIKTTVNARTINLYKNGVKLKEIYEYPIKGESYYNSLSVHPSKLTGLGGDYDGDVISLNMIYTDESIAEINMLMEDKGFYLSPDGQLLSSAQTDPLNLVLKHMTSK